jgi:multiple antibiotic resistance protein
LSEFIADWRPFVGSILLAVAALLPIVDPLTSIPMYLRLTTGVPEGARDDLAKAVALYSLVLLMGSALIGVYVLHFFGISIADVRVAGGIVVCSFAWSLLTSPDAGDQPLRPADAKTIAVDWRPRAFYPLTMPLTVGPGSMSVALTLGAHTGGTLRSVVATAIANTIGIVIVSISVYLCYRYAEAIISRISRTATVVVLRLSAFILLCIGVHITWRGAESLLKAAFPAM